MSILLARCPGEAFTQEELAEILGVSQGAIYHFERNALKRIRNRPEHMRALKEFPAEARSNGGPVEHRVAEP
jgi:DNA-directed RNA polymerase specialized sigma24 family protein